MSLISVSLVSFLAYPFQSSGPILCRCRPSSRCVVSFCRRSCFAFSVACNIYVARPPAVPAYPSQCFNIYFFTSCCPRGFASIAAPWRGVHVVMYLWRRAFTPSCAPILMLTYAHPASITHALHGSVVTTPYQTVIVNFGSVAVFMLGKRLAP